jgi:hypothetical protein
VYQLVSWRVWAIQVAGVGGTAAATAAGAPATTAATVATVSAEAGSPPAASNGRKCEGGMHQDTRGTKASSVTAGSIAAAAAAMDPAAGTDMARPRTPGSTAAGTTAGITAATAVMTADTTRYPLKEGLV